MKLRSRDARSRAAHLARWYPKEWRDRYGEEFRELLMDEIEERPRSMWLGLDVARAGVVAHLADLGFAGRSLDPRDHGRRSLAAFGCSVSLFVTLALALWAQLTIGWQWSSPDTGLTSSAMVVMTLAVCATVLACVACALPVLWSALRTVVREPSRRIFRPLVLTGTGLALLVVGTHHFANGWPGTGGHPWAHQGIVPGGIAAYAWASTLFVTTYWLHPGALAHFPGSEVAWMAASPLALAALVVGAAKTVRRLDLSTSILRFERVMGSAIATSMMLFFVGAALWVLDGGPGPRNLFHVGSIDVFELVAMGAALAVAGKTVGRTGDAVRLSAPR